MSKDKFADYSSTAASNTDVGGVNIQGSASIANGDDALRELMSHTADHFAQDSVADSATPDLGAEAAQYLTLAGTTTITSFGTIKAGTVKFVKFDSARTITRNATSLITLTGTDRTTTANSVGVYVSEGSGNWRELAYWDASTGVLLTERTAPATAASQGALYTKDSGTQPELFYREESSGDEVQLTRNGTVIGQDVAAGQVAPSGTNAEFTGIISTAQRIIISVYNFSTNGSAIPTLQLGTSGSYVTTGYLAGQSSLVNSSSVVAANSTSGVNLAAGWASSVVAHGHIILTNIGGNLWVISFSMGRSDAAVTLQGGGSISLGGTLTRLKIVTTDNIDSGTFNIHVSE